MTDPTDPTRGRTHYARLSYATLIIIPRMLRHWLLFYEPPQNLHKDCAKIVRLFNNSEWKSVQKAKIDGYDSFDISLIYKLLRNLRPQGFRRPTKDWDHPSDPIAAEVTEGDDLERCRRSRNAIIHRGDANISDQEFKHYIKMFAGIAYRLGKRLNRGEDFLHQIQEIEKCSMDEELEQKYIQQAQDFKEKLQRLEETIEKLSSPTDNQVVFVSPSSYLKCVEGENVTLECLAIGGKTKAVWYKDGEVSSLPTNALDESQNVTLKLVIPQVDKNHSGVYTVKVGDQKHDITVDVIEAIQKGAAHTNTEDDDDDDDDDDKTSGNVQEISEHQQSQPNETSQVSISPEITIDQDCIYKKSRSLPSPSINMASFNTTKSCPPPAESVSLSTFCSTDRSQATQDDVFKMQVEMLKTQEAMFREKRLLYNEQREREDARHIIDMELARFQMEKEKELCSKLKLQKELLLKTLDDRERPFTNAQEALLIDETTGLNSFLK